MTEVSVETYFLNLKVLSFSLNNKRYFRRENSWFSRDVRKTKVKKIKFLPSSGKSQF